jgi:alkylation response protein AidB-like acyl-CoA dehydrogenase
VVSVLASTAPGREVLVSQVRDLAPVLREQADRADQERRLPAETIAALAGAGVFRLRVPARYGGYQQDTRTLMEVGAALGRADGSVGWTASVYWIPGWMVGHFPDEVQDEVFADPDVRVCGTLSPGGMARPVDGGVVVSGEWGFITGAHHSQWQEIIAIQPLPDGTPMPIVALVPMADLRIVDDWHTSGMRGTGSVRTVAQEIFVPQHRVLPLPVVLNGQGSSAHYASSPIHRAPLLPVAAASSVGTALGLAQAARDVFLARLADRKLTYTDYPSQREAPITHVQVAEATMRIDEAEFHAHRLAALVDGKAAEAAEWTVAERVAARADLGAACRLAREAVDILAGASGASSLYQSVPIQRIVRDIHALNLHALINPTVNYELHGRILCGLEPNTQYI